MQDVCLQLMDFSVEVLKIKQQTNVSMFFLKVAFSNHIYLHTNLCIKIQNQPNYLRAYLTFVVENVNN